jgi:hypothetical protein
MMSDVNAAGVLVHGWLCSDMFSRLIVCVDMVDITVVAVEG